MTKYKDKKTIYQGLENFINDDVEVFEDEYQHEFIKVFIEDRKNWAQQIIDVVMPEYFDGFNRIIIDYQINFFQKYRIPADYNDLKHVFNDLEKDSIVKEQLCSSVDKIRDMDLEYRKRQFVKDRAYKYFKKQHMKNALLDCAVDWKKDSFEVMLSRVSDALKAGQPKDSGHDYARDYKKRLKDELRSPVPILDGLDYLIGGGISRGELAVVMAPTGGGKSMFLVRAATEAIKAGKKVVYYTLELSEELVGLRFDACINNIPLTKASKYEELIKYTTEKLKINLKIRNYPDGTADINTFYAHLDWLKSNENFEPDLIVVDYADNMKALTKGELLRHELVDIYRALRAMSIEVGAPCLTASQTSGDGYLKKEIELSMNAEAKAKNNIADLVLGFGRDTIQTGANKASLKILKNRNGSIGQVLPMDYDSRFVRIEVEDAYKKVQREMHGKELLIGAEKPFNYKKDTLNIDSLLEKQKK